MKLTNFLIFFSIFTQLSCSKNPIRYDYKDNFSIHFLKDSKITIDELHNLNLSDVELEPTPWLSSKNIEIYDYSSHYIYLKTSIEKFFPDFEGSVTNLENWHHRPFVVCASKNAIYAGSVRISIAELIRYDVFLLDRGLGEDQNNNILRIGNWTPGVLAIPQTSIDVRNNKNVKNALIDDGIFHAGLDVKLHDVVILNNTETSLVQYSFTITNNDKDDLYVINPEMVNDEILDITIPLILIDESKRGIPALSRKPIVDFDVLVNWQTSWFMKLACQDSITHTIIRKYPALPDGNYYCKLIFTNDFKIQKNERKRSDGRYWLGETKVEPIVINIGPTADL